MHTCALPLFLVQPCTCAGTAAGVGGFWGTAKVKPAALRPPVSLAHLVRHLGETLTFGTYLRGCEILIALK